jgi:dTDP-4-dehydrorhamnose 3,5-epimerase
MEFRPTPLEGAWLIALEPHEDARGAFARTFCAEEFRQHGLNPAVVQANLSTNHRAGTLRGLHYQVAPATEAKTVRCVRGAVFDVIVDVRSGSPTLGRWFGAELSAENGLALHVPEMFAHGFLTLRDDTVVTYQVSQAYTPGTERGLRYDDPLLGVEWPGAVTSISDKDAAWPLLGSLEDLS